MFYEEWQVKPVIPALKEKQTGPRQEQDQPREDCLSIHLKQQQKERIFFGEHHVLDSETLCEKYSLFILRASQSGLHPTPARLPRV